MVKSRSVIFLSLLFAALCPLRSRPAVDVKTAADIDRETEKIRPDMVKVRRYIHMYPELANHEVETSRTIAAKLASWGLEVKTGVARTGVVGMLRSARPGATVALRAAIDAVPVSEAADVPFKSLNPGIMHATGNDLHTAVVLGAAYVLSTLKDRFAGNVKFIFQPASQPSSENGESGAALMIKDGILDNPAVGAIFGFHVLPETLGQVFTAPGILLAGSDTFEITIKGRSAPGFQPQDGVDAIVLAAEIVLALQTIVSRTLDPADPALLTIGRIEGGAKTDVIADRVRLEGIVRTQNEPARRKIQKLMEAAVRGIVQAFGGDYAFTFKPGVPPLDNHPELVEFVLPALREALGERQVLPIKPLMMADDFAVFAQRVPAFFFFLGTRNPRLPPASLSSPHFNPDERAIGTGIKILAHLVLDGLERQSRMAKGEHPRP
ncbi:MAG: amidohydrolase [Candidatus Aminicenantes bacterium]|nr:amidohydrolase [Candidatus Aminicenantes bacterium]